ncbi:MAG: glutamine--fructose-6-phosphate transaminase (isomerizing) [Candidatus Pacebacteria bacterium]|nr:glutamine--fructose-6-phosphate transaminase (isomerizing) [Candidatus Paceibacterota bacterium]
MCGIIGYTGVRPASPILLDGLRLMEYRGYDSAGIFVPGSGVYKAVGPVQALADVVPGLLPGTAGIGHTRWATHGAPSVTNAHPHSDAHGRVWLVHNGIIENYVELRDALIARGHVFMSDTDTEVLAHCIGEEYDKVGNLALAATRTFSYVRGTYGVAVMCASEPDTILAARMGSPIAIGVKDGEYIVASDTAPLLRHTQRVLYLNDGEYVVLKPAGYTVYTFDHEPCSPNIQTLASSLDDVKKGGYPHFMLKEIMEIPRVLENSARGRILIADGTARLGGLDTHVDLLRNIARVTIVGCGSAYYAGMIGRLLFEDLAGIPTDIAVASEYRHRSIVPQAHHAALFVSQSGETADTIASLCAAKRAGMSTIGIVNVVGSTIARETDMGVYNHAGPEIGVASTKAFVSQLEVLTLVAVALGRTRGLSEARGAGLLLELKALQEKVRRILEQRDVIQRLAEDYLGYDDFLYLGRGYNVATAYEGALKLKEVSYVHAEGYPAGEMKHGPIAMIDETFPSIVIAPSDQYYDKNRSAIEELRARSGRVLAIATEGDVDIVRSVDDVFYIPHTMEMLTPVLANVALQLFAYYTGVLRGLQVDRPRNLAKSVTVE